MRRRARSGGGALSRAAWTLSWRCHRADGLSRLLPDRFADFHQVGQERGHSGRPGARLGAPVRWWPGRSPSPILDPLALGLAVRALPQPRTRLDAGLRRRLLSGPARRGDPPTCKATYGRDHVAQIITFGKLQARAALRDVGRVLQMPYPQVDRICKLVPNNPANPVTLNAGHRRRTPASGHAPRKTRRWRG